MIAPIADTILKYPPLYINVPTKGDHPLTIHLPFNKTVEPQKMYIPWRSQKFHNHKRTHGVDLAFAITANKIQAKYENA